MSGGLDELVDGHTEDATDAEEDEGDEDDDGRVSPEVVTEFVMSGELKEAATEERPGKETLFGGAHPRLKDKGI